MTDESAVHQALSDAIPDLIHQSVAEMVTKWLVILETVDANGKQGLWMESQAGVKSWDLLGMLEYARMTEHTSILRGEE